MVKAGCEELLRLLTQLGLTRVLNDNTHVAGIWVGAAAWVAGNWFPRLKQAGMRHFAWVQSPTRLSYISATTTVQQAEPGSAILFDNLADAETWLRAQV